MELNEANLIKMKQRQARLSSKLKKIEQDTQ